MEQGLFISFEGIDGVGKTTQAKLLTDYIRSSGHEVVHTCEPGGTKIGRSIRELLLDPSHDNLHSMTEIMLYAADRAQHVHEVIRPALTAGKIVISERYIDSSVAYQGFGLGLDLEAIRSINSWATQNLLPDSTIYLDLEPDEALRKRASEVNDRIEQRTLEYYTKVRAGFLQIARDDPARFMVVSATGTKSEVEKRIQHALIGRVKV